MGAAKKYRFADASHVRNAKAPVQRLVHSRSPAQRVVVAGRSFSKLESCEFRRTVLLPRCRQNDRNACGSCRGTGLETEKATLKVDIPAGVDNGMKVRLAGEGEASPTAAQWRLLLRADR